MTTQQNTLRCLACGSVINNNGSEILECKKCGEVFDLRVLSSMELDLDEFDKMLLVTLKGKSSNKRITRHR